MTKLTTVDASLIAERILTVRGIRVLLDSDLAAMYGVATKRFNEQVRRNLARFPGDFSFVLEDQDLVFLRSQIATSKGPGSGRGGRRYRPRVFTEHGAIMAATMLNSDRAIQMSIYVVRAFVEMKRALDQNAKVNRRLEVLERSLSVLDADTRRQFDQVYEAILGLMAAAKRQ